MARSAQAVRFRIAVIEQNPVKREELLALAEGAPGVTGGAGFSGLAEALPQLLEGAPEVVLVALLTWSESDFEGLRHLHQELPHTAVLVLSSDRSRAHFFQVLEAGISGWLNQPCAAEQIVRAILILHEGGAVLSSQATRQLLDYFQARGAALEGLTAREQEILRWLSQGWRSPAIAEKLGVSRQTLRTHIRNILEKLQVRSRAEALAKYLNPKAGSEADLP